MGLYEHPSLFFVGLAQIFAGFDGIGAERFQIFCLGDARAVRAHTAKIRQAIGHHRREAVHRLGQHERERVFARARGASQHHSLRKTFSGQHVAQAVDHVGVPMEI